MPACRLLLFVVLLALCVPASADIDAGLAEFVRQNRSADALNRSEELARAKPDDLDIQLARGALLAEAGRIVEAKAIFRRLMVRFPGEVAPANNLAVLMAREGQVEDARKLLEAALRTNAAYYRAYVNLRDVNLRLSSQAYAKALRMPVGDSDAGLKLAFESPLEGIRSAAAPTVAASPPAPVASAQSAAAQSAPTQTTSTQAVMTPATSAAASSASPATPAAKAQAPASPPVSGTGAPSGAPVASAAVPGSVPAMSPATPPKSATPTPATPAPARSASPPAAADSANETQRQVQAAVQAWLNAWSRKDVPAYLAFYGQDFTPEGRIPRRDWEQERRARILGKSRISVTASGMKVTLEGKTRAIVSFRQHYVADRLNVSSFKMLHLAFEKGRWVIVREATGN